MTGPVPPDDVAPTPPQVIVCVGPGGVGKTTTSAAVALACAEEGRRVVVMTVDPAKRLADALGLTSLPNNPTPVRLPRTISGSLDAFMLDTAGTFDRLVERHARSSHQARQILANTFYQNVSRSLSGTTEYMAMEKLFELATNPVDDDGEPIDPFDVIVVDTPPTKNALDLLQASDRLLRLLDNRVFRALMADRRRGFGVFGAAAQLALKPLGKIIGTDVLAEAVAFFQIFDGMEQGFRDRSAAAHALFVGPTSRWVLVSSPQRSTVAEAVALAAELTQHRVVISGVIGNRVQPLFVPLPSESAAPARLRPAIRRAEEANALGVAQRELLVPLAALGVPLTCVALRNTDVHSLAQLREISAQLRVRDDSGLTFSVDSL